MSTVQDLMGLGMPGPLASRLGNSVSTITPTGTSQATAAKIDNHVALFTPASGAAGIVFSSGASIGAPFYVCCSTNASVVSGTVYCPVSGTMNGTSNGSVTLTTGKNAIFMQVAALTWVSFPLSP